MTPFHLSVLFFLQLALVLVACRLVSSLARHLGQPPVVGEMIAGVAIGPSLLGLLAPSWQTQLFPAASKPILFCGAQLGLVLYMFLVGLEFRIDLVRSRLRTALAVSLSGILAPFALGCAIALWLLQLGGLFQPAVRPLQAAPYLGAAMAITAFPMLARIIVERGLAGTSVGTLSLAAGAIDDAAAWCVLALVLASFSNDASIALIAIGGSLALVVVAHTAGRRLLALFAAQAERSTEHDHHMFGHVLVLLMLVAWFTDSIGIYAVFGAFILGSAMPRGPFAERIGAKIEPLTTRLLLPLFFVYSGLNTRLDLITDPRQWLIAAVILAAAVLGKAGACYLAARLCGETHREAMGVGSLMNARGLMELIILNIGLERGLITAELFSIMVVMAVTTTLMATPLFDRFHTQHSSLKR